MRSSRVVPTFGPTDLLSNSAYIRVFQKVLRDEFPQADGLLQGSAWEGCHVDYEMALPKLRKELPSQKWNCHCGENAEEERCTEHQFGTTGKSFEQVAVS